MTPEEAKKEKIEELLKEYNVDFSSMVHPEDTQSMIESAIEYGISIGKKEVYRELKEKFPEILREYIDESLITKEE